jgi:phosphoribosyl 1,2-cyclic phosphodiesterase
MVMEICVLGSSSSGNSTAIWTKKTKILVDCGFSAKETAKRLDTIGLDLGDFDAVLLSHEHVDHVRGADVLSRRFGLPVYSNPTTSKSARNLFNVEDKRHFNSHQEFEIHDLKITPLVVPHDASEPNAFIIKEGKKKVALATDMGTPTPILLGYAQNSDLIILESNYDKNMLIEGFYPPPLKKRILSDFGHLSNTASSKTLKQIIGKSTKHVLLAHISQNNNTPDLALESANHHLKDIKGLDIGLTFKDKCTKVIKV